MISKFFKKILGTSEQKKSDSPSTPSLASNLHDKTAKLVSFFGEKIQNAHQEFFAIKDRIGNLRQTNYKLGLKHLENGHIKDAIFRFRFINKFWPELLDAHYQLAYCLTLDNKSSQAKIVLRELIANNPDYDRKAFDLLEHIEEGMKQKSFDE